MIGLLWIAAGLLTVFIASSGKGRIIFAALLACSCLFYGGAEAQQFFLRGGAIGALVVAFATVGWTIGAWCVSLFFPDGAKGDQLLSLSLVSLLAALHGALSLQSTATIATLMTGDAAIEYHLLLTLIWALLCTLSVPFLCAALLANVLQVVLSSLLLTGDRAVVVRPAAALIGLALFGTVWIWWCGMLEHTPEVIAPRVMKQPNVR